MKCRRRKKHDIVRDSNLCCSEIRLLAQPLGPLQPNLDDSSKDNNRRNPDDVVIESQLQLKFPFLKFSGRKNLHFDFSRIDFDVLFVSCCLCDDDDSNDDDDDNDDDDWQ